MGHAFRLISLSICFSILFKHSSQILNRRDYHKLNILRQLFPKVPILALSATCPPKVLQELVKILRLKPVVGGKGTLNFFSHLLVVI